MNTKVEEALATVSEYIGVAKPASSELTNDARLAVKALAAHIAAQEQRIAGLREALKFYMSQFGQGLEAHGIPFGPEQIAADAQARAALIAALGDKK